MEEQHLEEEEKKLLSLMEKKKIRPNLLKSFLALSHRNKKKKEIHFTVRFMLILNFNEYIT